MEKGSASNQEAQELALFKAIFDQVGDAIYIIDPVTSRIVDVNESGCLDLGMRREEVLRESVLSLQRDVKGMPQWHDIVAAIREAGNYVFVGRHVRKDGSEFPVEVHTKYISHGDDVHLVSIARDISDRVEREEAQRQRDYVYSFALNEAMDGLWDWNVATGDCYFSPQWKRMMGFGPNDVEHSLETWEAMVHPGDAERVYAALGRHLEGKTSRYQAEYRLRNRNGDYLWVQDRGTVVERHDDGRARRVVGMVQDITERKLMEERLHRIANRDDLTGLLNRRAGYEHFARYLKLGERLNHPLSVCLFDVDHFKAINDRFGHLTGDRVLQQVANTFADNVRESDVLFRWGGEEFLILLPDTDRAGAHDLAERFRTIIADQSHEAGQSKLSLTVSAGISCYPEDGDTIESLLATADRALYRAKHTGRNRIVA